MSENFAAAIKNFPGFFRFSFANILQIILMCSMLLTWWGNRESTAATSAATQAVMLQQLGDRTTKLEEANRAFSTGLQDVQNKVNVLVAIAEEQRKERK